MDMDIWSPVSHSAWKAVDPFGRGAKLSVRQRDIWQGYKMIGSPYSCPKTQFPDHIRCNELCPCVCHQDRSHRHYQPSQARNCDLK